MFTPMSSFTSFQSLFSSTTSKEWWLGFNQDFTTVTSKMFSTEVAISGILKRKRSKANPYYSSTSSMEDSGSEKRKMDFHASISSAIENAITKQKSVKALNDDLYDELVITLNQYIDEKTKPLIQHIEKLEATISKQNERFKMVSMITSKPMHIKR